MAGPADLPIADGKVTSREHLAVHGTFIHALNTRTGKVLWTNDGDGSMYMP